MAISASDQTVTSNSWTEGGNRIIKNWKPWHENLVNDKLRGMTNIQLAEKYNILQQYVSVIWTSRAAVAIRKQVHEQSLQENVLNFDERRKLACIKAFERMEKFLRNDKLAEAAPFPFMDRSMKAFEVLSETKTPHLPSVQNNSVTNNLQINLLSDPDKRNHLADGLTRALEAQNLHSDVSGNSIDGSIRARGQHIAVESGGREAKKDVGYGSEPLKKTL